VLFLAHTWADKALAQATALLKREPRNTLGIFLKAKAQEKKGDTSEAIITLNQATEAAPKFLPTYFALAELYRAENKATRMNEILGKAVKLDPENAVLHLHLGNWHYSRKELRESLRHYNAFLGLRPDNALALNQVAWTLTQLDQDLDRALELAKRAVKLTPPEKAGTVKDTVGWVYFKQQKYQEAEKELKQAVESVPDNPTIRYHLAVVYERQAKKKEAAAALEKALSGKEFPEANDARRLLDQLRE
jgi:tetratricopeptide (TPR) repeat protein